jgi:hypothetical protein
MSHGKLLSTYYLFETSACPEGCVTAPERVPSPKPDWSAQVTAGTRTGSGPGGAG